MGKVGWITGGVLGVVVLVILAALFREAAAGPSFRAQDHATYQECLRNIPPEWGAGSLQRSGAEDACHYVHRRAPAR